MHAHEIRTHEVTPIKYTLMSHMPMKVYSREMACPRDARPEVYAHETHAYEIHALEMLARKVLGGTSGSPTLQTVVRCSSCRDLSCKITTFCAKR
jgi:hypothetical protein